MFLLLARSKLDAGSQLSALVVKSGASASLADIGYSLAFIAVSKYRPRPACSANTHQPREQWLRHRRGVRVAVVPRVEHLKNSR